MTQRPSAPEPALPSAAEDTNQRRGKLSGLSPIELANELLRHRRSLVFLPFVLAVLIVGIGLIPARKYTSTLAFVPQVSDAGLGGAGALAAQFGVSVPGVDLTQTPDFYASLVRSEQLARQLVESRYSVRGDNGQSATADLITFFKIKTDNPAQARELAAIQLASSMKVSSDLRTAAVRVDVSTRDPNLSMQIALRTLDLVNEFNTVTRRSRYGEERRFVVGRVTEAKQDLRRAEDALQSFLDNNRDYASSPPLLFVHDRLDREVQLRSALFSRFSQQYEDARVQEARNTPVVTVVTRPIPAAFPDRRFLAFKGIASVAFGFMLVAFVIIVRYLLRRAESSANDDAQEFLVLWHEAVDDVRTQIRRVLPRRRAASA